MINNFYLWWFRPRRHAGTCWGASAWSGMPTHKAAVTKLARAIDDGEQVIAKEKKTLKKTRGKLAKRQKKRALKVIRMAVEAMQEHKEAVETGAAAPPAA
jgi:hypothetical protein